MLDYVRDVFRRVIQIFHFVKKITRTSDVLESILLRKIETVSGIPTLTDLVVLLMITCFVGRV